LNYENVIFKDVKGQVIDLQSTTLQKDIPNRQLVFTFLDGKPGILFRYHDTSSFSEIRPLLIHLFLNVINCTIF
jgi:hypothetical protein